MDRIRDAEGMSTLAFGSPRADSAGCSICEISPPGRAFSAAELATFAAKEAASANISRETTGFVSIISVTGMRGGGGILVTSPSSFLNSGLE